MIFVEKILNLLFKRFFPNDMHLYDANGCDESMSDIGDITENKHTEVVGGIIAEWNNGIVVTQF